MRTCTIHVNVYVYACECFFFCEWRKPKGKCEKVAFLFSHFDVRVFVYVRVCVCMFDNVYEREKFEREGGDRKRDKDYRLQYMSVVHGKYNITTK